MMSWCHKKTWTPCKRKLVYKLVEKSNPSGYFRHCFQRDVFKKHSQDVRRYIQWTSPSWHEYSFTERDTAIPGKM